MDKQELYDYIDRYLNDQLSESKKIDFDKRLIEDASFQKEVRLQSEIKEAIHSDGFQNFRSTLKTIDQGWKEAQSVKRRTLFTLNRIAIAASVALMIGVGFWWFQDETLSNSDLFAQNFEPYDMVLSQRSYKDDLNRTLESAIFAYSSGEFETSSELFSSLDSLDQELPLIQFYSCISMMAADQIEPGIDCLKDIKGQHQLQQPITWYLALALIKADNNAEARQLLERIPPSGYKYENAQYILGRMK